MSALGVQPTLSHTPIYWAARHLPRRRIAHQRAPYCDGEAIQKERGRRMAALSSCCSAVAAGYAAFKIAADGSLIASGSGSPSNVSRSDRLTTVAIFRLRSNLSQQA